MYAGASNGNHRWPQNCPSCDNALEDNFRQSPIDLNSDLVRMGAKPLPKLTFTPDVEDTMGEYVNTVNTLQFNAADSSANTMCGGPLTGEYNFAQVHCHWGRTNYKPEDPTNPPKRVTQQGSEHWIEGVQYDAECHWVHYNNKYDDLGAAVAAGVSGDGEALSVVGVMLDIDDDNKQEDIDWVGVSIGLSFSLITTSPGFGNISSCRVSHRKCEHALNLVSQANRTEEVPSGTAFGASGLRSLLDSDFLRARR